MKKPGFKKKKFNLTVECEDNNNGLEKSVYSEIGPDGLRFLKDGIKVSQQGLQKFASEDNTNSHTSLISLQDLQIFDDDKIGSGVSAQVVKGRYKPLDIDVAIKKINVYDKEKRHQLMNDIKILLSNKIKQEKNNTNCNFIVDLYGAFFDQGTVKVILELMDVGSLADLIKLIKHTKQIPENPSEQHDFLPFFPEPIMAKICQQVLNGLMYLYIVGKQVHRDIKPANILINSQGEVKLTDFGISKELDESHSLCMTQIGTK